MQYCILNRDTQVSHGICNDLRAGNDGYNISLQVISVYKRQSYGVSLTKKVFHCEEQETYIYIVKYTIRTIIKHPQ